MYIDNLTIGELKTLTGIINPAEKGHLHDVGPWQIGQNYFIRTVTFHYTGKLTGVTDHELTLDHAAWIADSGRFHEALESGNYTEVEMFPKNRSLIIGRGAIVDAITISAPLPTSNK